jgi:site-specific DNA-methyltransferase (adenine-specific)
VNPYYQDHLVRLYHGDCREITDWLAADVLVTDPPYGVHRNVWSTTTNNPPAIAGELRTGWASDRVLGPEHVAVRDDALKLWGTRPAVVFGHWRAPRPAGTRMRLIWDRMWTGNGGVQPWRPVDEEIYIVGDWPNPDRGPRGAAVPSILRHRAYGPHGAARPNHPTPKPIPLMLDLLQHCPPGSIADPFAGSGATLLAAREIGRPVIGVEVEERHCELIATRLTQNMLPFGDAS